MPTKRGRKRDDPEQSAQEGSVRVRHAEARKDAFLTNLAVMGNVTAAAACVQGLSRQTVYKHWLPKDEDFKEAFDEAIQESMDRLEQEARRRAVEGVTDYVVSQGKLVIIEDPETGERVPLTKKVYSDTLMVLLLKAYRPDRFSERHKLEQGEKPITFTLQFEGPATPDA